MEKPFNLSRLSSDFRYSVNSKLFFSAFIANGISWTRFFILTECKFQVCKFLFLQYVLNFSLKILTPLAKNIVVFDIQQRKKKKYSFQKLKFETFKNLYLVFAILLAAAEARTCSIFVYNLLKTTAAIILLTYLLWRITSPTETIASTPETITSSDVMYILTL